MATTPEQPLHPEIHVFPAQTAAIAIERAVRAGHDTDTVAAIAGSLVGARWGMSALPARWLSVVHGWPGMRANDLQHLAQALVSVATDKARVAEPIPASVSVSQWPNSGVRVEVPSQRGLTVAGQQGMRDVASREDPAGMRDAAGTRASAGTQVVSLSRVGSDETSLAHRHLPVFVLDQPGCNPNLHFSLVDVSETVAQWLDGGEVVLHCVQAENRTPAFAAAYLVSQLGLTPEQARAEVASVLPAAKFAAHLFDAVTDLPPRVTGDGPALGDELLRRGHDGAIYAVTPSVVLRRHHAAWTLHEGGADDSWTAATWADVVEFDEAQRSTPAAV